MNFDVAEKYGKAYFMPPEVTYDWVKKDAIEKPPIWCSVDLRDGNQALIEPMNLEEKLNFPDACRHWIQGDRGWFPGSFRDRVQFHACLNRAQYDPGRCYRSGFNTGA